MWKREGKKENMAGSKRITFEFTPERYAKLEETAQEAGHAGPDAVKELMLALLKQYHVNQCTMRVHQEREQALVAARDQAMADLEDE